MNRFESKVEFYGAAEETLWESGEIKDALLDIVCIVFAFLLIAAYWRFV